MGLFTSNLVQLVGTVALGFGLCLICSRFPALIRTCGYLISVSIILSALFSVGEVYVYSAYYRRSFSVFGDEITTVTAFFFLYSFVERDRVLASASAGAMFLSGGKVSFFLFSLMVFVLFLSALNLYRSRLSELGGLLAAGLIIYASVIGLASMSEEQPRYARRGACPNVEICIKTQVYNAIEQRYFSFLGGAWMISRGGFPGENYPGTAHKFADFMMKANPWQINDRHHLNWQKWYLIGTIQNAYISFGSGYGPWLLLALLTLIGVGVLSATRILRSGADEITSLCAVCYLVNTVFNHTQSWMSSASPILILVSFCAARVCGYYILARFKPRGAWLLTCPPANSSSLN